MIQPLFTRVRGWLLNAPVTDPVDRRNAPTMQALFLLLGVSIPVSWLYFITTRGMPPGGGVLMSLALAMALLAFVCVAMIRKGRFRAAIWLYLIALLVSQEFNHLRLGFQAIGTNQIDQFMMLIIGGLVLGRPALWTIFAALLVIAASGFAVDALRLATVGGPVAPAFGNLPSLVFGYLLVALVLDRTITALRESLAESNARGRELQHEMLERERAQSRLLHSQKMEASGRLASGIAHDFNNILGVILGFARQRHAIRDQGGPVKQADALEDSLAGVEIAAHRGAEITRKLLSFSRKDVLRIEQFDVGQALLELFPLLRQLFPPSVQLELSGQELAPVWLDRSEFELMILNIAANARDAMPHGGRFEVRIHLPSPNCVEIILSDTGAGMDEHVRARVFEPFFTTKAAGDGTGLGLAVIHDLIKAIGGDIRADSELGVGTTFTIRLPLAEPSTSINGNPPAEVLP